MTALFFNRKQFLQTTFLAQLTSHFLLRQLFAGVSFREMREPCGANLVYNRITG
jgi:hypothetical protein